MSYVTYTFSAIPLSPTDVVLHATSGCLPLGLTPEETDEVWLDIVNSFTHGGFLGVAAILETLPYTRDRLGTFMVGGPILQRREIFHLLIQNRIYTPGSPRSVSIDFYRSDHAPQLSVYYRVGHAWDVEQTRTVPACIEKSLERAASP